MPSPVGPLANSSSAASEAIRASPKPLPELSTVTTRKLKRDFAAMNAHLFAGSLQLRSCFARLIEEPLSRLDSGDVREVPVEHADLGGEAESSHALLVAAPARPGAGAAPSVDVGDRPMAQLNEMADD